MFMLKQYQVIFIKQEQMYLKYKRVKYKRYGIINKVCRSRIYGLLASYSQTDCR